MTARATGARFGVELHGTSGADRVAVRASIAYKGCWVRRVRTFAKDGGGRPSGRRRRHPELIGEVLNVMKKVAYEGMTMIVVTHEMGFARDVADRVLVMAEGELIEDAVPEDLFNDPKDPRTKALIERYRTGEQ